ncbi:hypothetical protein A2995_00840 [Candidatus Nomurabacteria bacterium RIFCSPLOWO2_01_FULL_33_24]|uniref:DNA repair and recombination protein RadB n=1 Tax=Candidatus Nomurabacteria bacterium RIFCSPLOWO2_01_FULL_33_24 TaxID=1801765 RepID=A0A1F6X2V9_9BACT|nr:MAG: hypothetical protein A2995_00840 [Candidatus Nomurabacteria bacterium RIFCSPLOWO2_01_FULL_33_24]
MKINSGCQDFDLFLEGGYESGLITGFYGAASTGKTTLVMLAALEQIKRGKKVFFIDTEHGFSIERFQQLGGSKNSMESLFVFDIKDFNEQCMKLEEIGKIKDFRGIGLIVIDTMSFFYRIALQEDKVANSKVARQFKILSYLSREYDIPVLVTHQVYSKIEKNDTEVVGGDMIKNWCKWLIHLQKGKKRKAVLVKPLQREFIFQIAENGIQKI